MSAALDLPSDPAMDAWRVLLDENAVLEACRSQLARVEKEARSSWRECRRIETLYHPGRYLRAAYVLLDDPNTPQERQWPEGQIVYLHVPVREPLSRRGVQVCIGDQAAEAYLFPNDRRLRGLRKFAGRDSVIATWQDWAARSGDDFLIDADSLQRLLVRYVPEQKWVVRLRAEGAARGTRQKRRIGVRAAGPADCGVLRDRHMLLGERARQAGCPFLVPAVVGESIDEGLLAIEWIRGTTLLEALRTTSPAEVMQRIADVLVAFQSLDFPHRECVGIDHAMERIRHACEDLSVADPSLAPRLAALAATLRARGESLPSVAPATLHGDFHWNQFRMKGDRFALLDLERVTAGDPLVDVANFASQILMLGQRPETGVDPATARDWASWFLHAWTEATRGGPDSDRAAFYSGLSLLELSRGMLRHVRPGWRALAARCVDAAEATLDRAQLEGVSL